MTTPRHFDGHPIAPWMLPRLEYARRHGWGGVVFSGYRTPSAQMAAAKAYAARLGRPLASVYPSGPLASNHCRLRWPGGAIDVTQADELNEAMKRWKGEGKARPLVWGGPVMGDVPHFSATGR